jgi:hypothetical protein
MNRDDIIRMAREAGLDAKVFQFYGIDEPRIRLDGLHWHGELERFAALVAAAEREQCALVCENIEDHDETISDTYYSDHYANAIRARGDK